MRYPTTKEGSTPLWLCTSHSIATYGAGAAACDDWVQASSCPSCRGVLHLYMSCNSGGLVPLGECLLVSSSQWDESLKSPLPMPSSSNSKSNPARDGKEKFCPAPDSSTLDVPPDTLCMSALLQRITKPTHWPSRSPKISPVYTDSLRTCTTWTATSNGHNFIAFSSISHLMLS